MIKTFRHDTKSASEIEEIEYGASLPHVEVEASRLGKVLPMCYRCTQVPKEGLYDGFRVQGMFFCSDCQQELFTAEQGSSEYQEFMFLIKGIFYI